MAWRMKGQYLKNCSCLATCPCDTIGAPAPNKFCEGIAGMRIEQGNFDDVDLSGLSWVGIVHFPGALFEGNGTLEAFIDEKADDRQRNALIQILTGQAGNPWFEILSEFVSNLHGPHFLPIHWEFDLEKRHARVSIPGFLETHSAPLASLDPRAAEGHNRVIVKMPDGVEYKEMEVARTVSLRSSGAIKFDWHNTHSSLAAVDHTHEGLVA